MTEHELQVLRELAESLPEGDQLETLISAIEYLTELNES